MLYTFSSFVCLPELDPRRINEVRKSRPWLIIHQEPNTANRWRISKKLNTPSSFPSLYEWKSFFSEPEGVGKVEILEFGIKFSPALIVDPQTKNQLRGNISGLAILDPGGSTRYWIRSGCYGVQDCEVGIYLTPGINSWQDVSFEAWNAFIHVAHRYDRLLRVQRKLEQLRGTRENSGAFDRLSSEIRELISESLMEV